MRAIAVLLLIAGAGMAQTHRDDASQYPQRDGIFLGLQEAWHTERGFLETQDQHCVDRFYTIQDGEHTYVAGQSTCHPNWNQKLSIWPNTPVKFIVKMQDGHQILGIVGKKNRVDWFGVSSVTESYSKPPEQPRQVEDPVNVRVAELSKEIERLKEANKQLTTQPISRQAKMIINMSLSGYGKAAMIDAVGKFDDDFSPSAADIEALQRSNIPEDVIAAMKAFGEAHRKKE